MKKKQGKVIQKVKGWIKEGEILPLFTAYSDYYLYTTISKEKRVNEQKHVEITVREI